MNTDLRLAIAQCATRRAHLAGAEAAELETEAASCARCGMYYFFKTLEQRARAARRRYWREVEAVALLSGHRWPEAERLGGGA
jgi:hypothetical protein